jgi:NTE family protein
VPLPPDRLEPVGAARISHGGYRFTELPVSPDAPDLLVMVAISGGGKRSASFGWGALKGMRDVAVPTLAGPRPLLDQVDAISGVSGGSFPAAYYGLYGDQGFGHFESDFLYQDTNAVIFGIYLLPWNWAWLVRPGIGTNDFMDRAYDRAMFHGATYDDFRKRGRPLIAVGATDISWGTPFLFTQETFDLVCSDLSVFPISRAVAASNGFPGLFSPITLTNHAADCGGRAPAWLGRVTEAQRNDPLSRTGVEATRAERYLDPERTRYLHLSDGGVADNLAMRAAGTMISSISAADLNRLGMTKIRRLLMISVDGQSAQDSTVAQRRDVGGILSMIGLVSGGQIDNFNFETLTVITQQLEGARETLIKARCQAGPVFEGTRCDDVQATLLHIALRDLPESPEKAHLQSIPTGLTIPRQDVDLLIQAGHDAVTNSRPLRQFLDNYPPEPLPQKLTRR